MAQKAKKSRAKSNAATLNGLHAGTAFVHALFLLAHFFVRPRSLLLWAVLSAPGLACELFLEKAGRPRYDAASGALLSSGEDLAAPGLTEYMLDVVWVTWGAAGLAALVGDAGWLLWAAVPAYGGYLAYGLVGAGRQTLAQMQGAGTGAGAGEEPQGNRRSRRAA